MSAATEQKRQRALLEEQIKEVEREIRQRARVYPKWVEEGRYKPETAEMKLATMRDVHDTLMWLEANLSWIKPQAVRRAREKRFAAEAEALLDHPAVSAVMDAFQGAEITEIRQREDSVYDHTD